MDGHMNDQCETIIPRHYHVAGYKNGELSICSFCKSVIPGVAGGLTLS